MTGEVFSCMYDVSFVLTKNRAEPKLESMPNFHHNLYCGREVQHGDGQESSKEQESGGNPEDDGIDGSL